MGADLYILSVYEEREKKYSGLIDLVSRQRDALAHPKARDFFQSELENYYALVDRGVHFRDPYNEASVAQALGFSWWADVQPLLNKDNRMSLKGIKKFLKMVEEAPLEITDAEVKKKGLQHSGYSTAYWRKYFRERKVSLVEFLKNALEIGEPIFCCF